MVNLETMRACTRMSCCPLYTTREMQANLHSRAASAYVCMSEARSGKEQERVMYILAG